MKKEISILAELGTGLYAIKPIVEELSERDVSVYLYTISDNIEQAHVLLGIDYENIYPIKKLVSHYYSRIDFILKQLLVNNNFSSQYKRINKSSNTILNFIIKLAILFPKPNQKNVNRIYHSFWKLFNRKSFFKTKNVLYVTRGGITYPLNSYYHKVYTLVESWDHPVKSPFFTKSEIAYTWNNDLAITVKEYQGESNVVKCFPFKFRYIQELLERNVNVQTECIKKEIDFIHSNPYILYICTYSSFSGEYLFENERKLIKQIIKMVGEEGEYLYVKPHPHGKKEDFDFLKSVRNVRIGIPAIYSGFNYVFSDEEQFYKMLLLKNASVVINVGTTLVLEASFLNSNIIQIDLSNDFGGFSNVSQNYHIKHFLNSKKGVLKINVKDLSVLEKRITDSDDTFARELQNWICPEKTLNKSIEELIDAVL